MQRLAPPKTRLKSLLQLLVEIPAAAEQAMMAITLPQDEKGKRLLMFDVGVLVRASNALKVIRLLCEQAHWEFAAAAVRQLFELVLNVEYLATQPDREAAIFLYSKYGLLQTVRHQHLALLYDQKTGRPIDEQRLAMLASMLEHTFPEFRSVDKAGKVHWKPSWSGHTTRYLAERSKHSLRQDQYHLLFAAWSEETHGAPAALIGNMFLDGRSVQEIVASDDTRIAETVAGAISLFLELWTLLPHLPQVDPMRALEWTSRMIAEANKRGASPRSFGPRQS
jgi:Family of unknown function (DUF5677)